MLRVRAATGINKKKKKKKRHNQPPNEGESYSTNKNEILCKDCGERHVRGEKRSAQPSVRHVLFAKEKKSRPEGVQIQKKVEKVKDTQVD